MAYQKFPSEVFPPPPEALPSAPPYIPYQSEVPYSSAPPQYMFPYPQPLSGCEGHCNPPPHGPHPPPPFYPPPPPPSHGHAGYPPYSYQGYFNDGFSYSAPHPTQLPPRYLEDCHHHESESESEDNYHDICFCLSCLKGCLAGLCCCCLLSCL
ncbi:hypothetical protein ZOSMA_132G00450 [Zostera marina]|uniref:Cysteine-rich transmembrane CYSTM domain-containing protein n=1 Tax=Zostera marina TaxID=29655 RepID=A0A0K9Q197_ZOSMR|nr:hypothetical protein ZOSMA_132G00450 [Zostera marina]